MTGFVSDNEVLVDDGVAVAVLTNHMAGGAEADCAAGRGARWPGDASSRRPEKQALAIYRGLQKGQIDRSLLAPNLNDYFSAQTVADFRDSLAPLGEPLTFTRTR